MVIGDAGHIQIYDAGCCLSENQSGYGYLMYLYGSKFYNDEQKRDDFEAGQAGGFRPPSGYTG